MYCRFVCSRLNYPNATIFNQYVHEWQSYIDRSEVVYIMDGIIYEMVNNYPGLVIQLKWASTTLDFALERFSEKANSPHVINNVELEDYALLSGRWGGICHAVSWMSFCRLILTSPRREQLFLLFCQCHFPTIWKLLYIYPSKYSQRSNQVFFRVSGWAHKENLNWIDDESRKNEGQMEMPTSHTSPHKKILWRTPNSQLLRVGYSHPTFMAHLGFCLFLPSLISRKSASQLSHKRKTVTLITTS